MNVSVELLPKSQAKLTIELSLEEMQPYVDAAAKHISKETSIKGFRKGNVPYDVLKQHVGENTIFEEAFSHAVEDTYPKAVDQEKLHIVGRAQIDVEKLAPGNPVIYTAIVPLMPKVELGEYKKINAQREEVKMDEEKFKKTMDDLKRMRAKEVLVDREAKDGDAVIIDFDVKVDGVSIEGGQGTKSRLVLGSGQFIPGFEAGVIGMKKDEEREIEATFPEDYFKKDLAGKTAKPIVKLHEVYEIQLPEMNDEFAKELNFESVAKLEEEIKGNIMRELEDESMHKFEADAIKEVVASSKMDDMPESLVEEESQKMLQELQYDIMQRGLKFEDYLTHLKKTQDELMADFATQATERIKAALVLRELAVAENLEVTKEEVEKELEETRTAYAQSPEALAQIESPAYRGQVENGLMNKKVFEMLEKFSKN